MLLIVGTDMPRKELTPKIKSKRKTWDKKCMIDAVEMVRAKKMGLKKAVKMFKVPKTTLQRLVQDAVYSAEEVVEKKTRSETSSSGIH